METLHERIKVAERLLVDVTHHLATRDWQVADRKVRRT